MRKLMSKGRYIGSNFLLFVIVICFRFLLGSTSRQTIHIGEYALREETIWCTFCFHFYIIIFFLLLVCCAVVGTRQTINVHFREGWLSILGNALYNICRENGPMRNSLVLLSLGVIQYKLHALASSSSPHIVSRFVWMNANYVRCNRFSKFDFRYFIACTYISLWLSVYWNFPNQRIQIWCMWQRFFHICASNQCTQPMSM